MSKVFTNAPRDRGSIPGGIISKTQKMVLYAFLLSTQHCKVKIKGKVGQSKEWSSAPLNLGLVAIEKGAKITNFTFYINTEIDNAQQNGKFRICVD